MLQSRLFLFILGLIQHVPLIVVAESHNAAKAPYDALKLEAVEERASKMEIEDTSSILDVVHDDTRELTKAAHSDRILGEARADLWRKKKDREEQMYFASAGAEDAAEERKLALENAARSRQAMIVAQAKGLGEQSDCSRRGSS
jgi:hypothetical protein